MSTRQIQFFATPSEFFVWMRKAQDAMMIEFALEMKDPNPGYQLATLAEVEEAWRSVSQPFWRFYVSSSGNTWPICDPEQNPNTWGFVTCEPPQIRDGALLMATVSSKSDSYGRPLERGREAHRLYSKLKKIMLKHLEGPVWFRRTGSEGKGRPIKDRWFSAGAEEWYSVGGVWRQQGIVNSVFFPPGGVEDA